VSPPEGWRGVAFLLMGLLWGGIPCQGQSIVHFRSGPKYECKILEYNNGVFFIELPDGTRKKAGEDYITRIQFVTTTPDTLPAEFGLGDVPNPNSPPPKPAVRIRNSLRLKLASNWQARLPRGDLALGDTARLLSKCGTPQIDLAGQAITLWGKITYLMPLRKAKKILSLGPSSKDPIQCASFPPRSFFFHVFNGSFEDGFKRLFLITDMADQIVGVQLQDNSSRTERWFPYPQSYSADWSLYNFVQDRKKAKRNWEVGFYVCKGSQRIMGYPPGGAPMNGETGVNKGVVRIDSDLFSIARDRYNYINITRSKSRERVRLILAQPIVDLMLYVVQKSR